MNRWTGRSIWVPDTEPPPRGWYPYNRSVSTTGRFCRERKRWWVLVVLFRIYTHAWESR